MLTQLINNIHEPEKLSKNFTAVITLALKEKPKPPKKQGSSHSELHRKYSKGISEDT
jgi:hypothetical protein